MKRKTKISQKSIYKETSLINKDSILILLQVLPILATIYAIYQTNNSLELTKKSTAAAQEAVELQRKEIAEATLQSQKRHVLDSLLNKAQKDLAQEQIKTLEKQAIEFKRNVDNQINSERPLLDVEKIGMHSLSAFDTFSFSFKIINRGKRPAILKKVNIYLFDENFKILGQRHFNVNTLLIDSKVQQIRLPFFEDKVEYKWVDRTFIATLNNHFLSINFEFEDKLHDKSFSVQDPPLVYKWIRRPIKDWVLQIDGNDNYLPYELCSDEEEAALRKSISKYNNKK